MVDYLRLSEVMIELSRCLITTDQGVERTLTLLCDRVDEVLPVRGTGVMLADELGVLHFVEASDERLSAIEALQIELGEGPCVRAYMTGEAVLIPDLAEDTLFADFSPRALESGLRSVFSFPMRIADTAVGALNLYADGPQPFDAEDAVIGQALADIAAAFVLNLRTSEQASLLNHQLQVALDSRVIIEQAKGRLSEQLGVDVDKAFERLRRFARSRSEKLRDVAARIVAGELRLDSADDASGGPRV